MIKLKQNINGQKVAFEINYNATHGLEADYKQFKIKIGSNNDHGLR